MRITSQSIGALLLAAAYTANAGAGGTGGDGGSGGMPGAPGGQYIDHHLIHHAWCSRSVLRSVKRWSCTTYLSV